jgi:hypothetical protein
MIDLHNRLAQPLPQLNGRTPYEILTGNTPDISEFLDHDWYQPVWFYELNVFPTQNKQLARWIGISHRVGQALCYWILPKSGISIARTMIQAITREEAEVDVVRKQIDELDQAIYDKLQVTEDDLSHLKLYHEDGDQDNKLNDTPQQAVVTPDIDHIEADAYDELLLTEPLLSHEGRLTRATIIGRKRDQDGNPMGTYHHNPLLNTRICLTEFPDGHIAEYSANIISEAIYRDIDKNGIEEIFFDSIIGHERDHTAVTRTEAEAIMENEKNGIHNHINNSLHPLFTTKGWHICISWKDGSTSWHPLSDIKNSFPVQLADYAIKNNLQDEPAFKWWVTITRKKQESFIKATKSRYAKRTHKFGIGVPRTVEEALAIDKDTNTTFWHNAIQKEMRNNRLAFKFLEDSECVPIGYIWI